MEGGLCWSICIDLDQAILFTKATYTSILHNTACEQLGMGFSLILTRRMYQSL